VTMAVAAPVKMVFLSLLMVLNPFFLSKTYKISYKK